MLCCCLCIYLLAHMPALQDKRAAACAYVEIESPEHSSTTMAGERKAGRWLMCSCVHVCLQIYTHEHPIYATTTNQTIKVTTTSPTTRAATAHGNTIHACHSGDQIHGRPFIIIMVCGWLASRVSLHVSTARFYNYPQDHCAWKHHSCVPLSRPNTW